MSHVLCRWQSITTILAVISVLAIGSQPAVGQESGTAAESSIRTLYDITGRRFQLRKLPKTTAIVLAWTSEGCPMSKVYSPRIVQIAKDFEAQGVRFFVVDSSPQDSAAFLEDWAQVHGASMPLIYDDGGRLATSLEVARTTEVLVFNRNLDLQYRGAIDDQYGFTRELDAETGRVGTYRKPEPSANYLRQALESVIAGEKVNPPQTEAWGCALGTWPKPTATASTAPTYFADVQPILENNCSSCHHRGGNAPFSLQGYKKASGWADTIQEVIASGAMPPWNANPAHGEFSNARGLSAAEKETITAWIAAGTPKGKQPAVDATVDYPDEWSIGEPDLVMAVPGFEVPAEGVLPYQYFRVEKTFENDTWLQAAETRSTNSEVVHHVLMFLDSPHNRPKDLYEPWRPRTNWNDLVQGTTKEEANHFFGRARQAQRGTARSGSKAYRERAEELGFRENMRTSRQNGLLGYFLSSLPGANSRVFPEGQGKFIPAGSRMVFQFHFTPNGRAQTTETRLGLKFATERPREVVQTHALTTLALRIPAGEANYVRRVEFKIEREGQLLSLHPHMHYRGKSFRYELQQPNGDTEILLDVPHYDFDWQHEYRLKEPKLLQPGAVLIGTAVYDNSEQNPYNPNPAEEVYFGLQSFEEMYVGYFSVIWDESASSQKPK